MKIQSLAFRVLAASCLVAQLFGQASDSIIVTVTDSTGAAIAGTVVTASNTQTGVKYTSVTNGSGHYVRVLGMPRDHLDAVQPLFQLSRRMEVVIPLVHRLVLRVLLLVIAPCNRMTRTGGAFRGSAFKKIEPIKTLLTNDEEFRHNAIMIAKRRRPTEAELAILRVLWEGKARSVRAIQQVLNQSRPTGYTTVLKLMQIMTEKGLIERDENQRPQLYRARYSQTDTQRQLVGDLLDRAFGGSVKALVLQALAAKKSSVEELEAMEELLDRIEGGKK